jgi:hypothetical protein
MPQPVFDVMSIPGGHDWIIDGTVDRVLDFSLSNG